MTFPRPLVKICLTSISTMIFPIFVNVSTCQASEPRSRPSFVVTWLILFACWLTGHNISAGKDKLIKVLLETDCGVRPYVQLCCSLQSTTRSFRKPGWMWQNSTKASDRLLAADSNIRFMVCKYADISRWQMRVNQSKWDNKSIFCNRHKTKERFHVI